MSRIGRPSIFPGEKCERVQALISSVGKQRFEMHRIKLARLARLQLRQVSDAAVVEYLARGAAETRRLINDSRTD